MVGDAPVPQPRDDDCRDLNELFLLSVEDDPDGADGSFVGDVTSCGRHHVSPMDSVRP